MIIKRYCDEVVICYDADEAGQKATQRAINILRPTGIKIKILTVPNGKDPDEFIKSHGDQGSARFRMLLERSGNDIEYRIMKLRQGYNTEIPEQKVEFATKAAGLIALLENPVEQDVYTSRLSRELEIEKSAFKRLIEKSTKQKYREFKKTEQRQAQDVISGRADKLNTEKRFNLRAANAEEAIISLMIHDPDTAMKIARELPADNFVTRFNRHIYEVLKNRIDEGREITMTDISGELTQDEMGRISGMMMSHPREKYPDQAAGEYMEILIEQKQRLTPEQAATADNDTIMEQLRRLREKKK